MAANASAAFLYGEWLGASDGILQILDAASRPPAKQLAAIAESGWASSGYYGGKSLRGTYRLVRHVRSPPRAHARVVIDERTVLRVP